MMSIGEVLKQARKAKNISQEDAAEKVGVSRQTMSSWENGKSYPDVANVMALSDAYNVTLDSLLKGDTEMVKHLEESTNVTKSKKQVAASIIALGIFLLGTLFTIILLGGHPLDYFNLPTVLFIIIFLIVVLTITRSFKLFFTGFRAALFPKNEISDEKRDQAAKLFRLLSKTTVLAAAITTLISLINMLLGVDYSAQGIYWTLGVNIAASLLSLFYGLIIAFIFEPVAYLLMRSADRKGIGDRG